MNPFQPFIIFFLLLILAPVKSYPQNTTPHEIPITNEELILPDIPENLTKEEKISFILNHFWDNMDFENEILSLNRPFIEQNFANYAYILQHVNDSDLKQKSINILLGKAECNIKALKLLTEIAGLYLYQPDSPYFDEEAYIPVMLFMIHSDIFNDTVKSRNKFLLDTALKNRKGDYASNFSYLTKHNKILSLDQLNILPDQKLLLMFYNPDCNDCREAIIRLKTNNRISELVENNNLIILAIYPGKDKDLWVRYLPELGDDWLSGINLGEIDNDEIYFFTGYPSFYLLDNQKKVLLKDATFDKVLMELN